MYEKTLTVSTTGERYLNTEPTVFGCARTTGLPNGVNIFQAPVTSSSKRVDQRLHSVFCIIWFASCVVLVILYSISLCIDHRTCLHVVLLILRIRTLFPQKQCHPRPSLHPNNSIKRYRAMCRLEHRVSNICDTLPLVRSQDLSFSPLRCRPTLIQRQQMSAASGNT